MQLMFADYFTRCQHVEAALTHSESLSCRSSTQSDVQSSLICFIFLDHMRRWWSKIPLPGAVESLSSWPDAFMGSCQSPGTKSYGEHIQMPHAEGLRRPPGEGSPCLELRVSIVAGPRRNWDTLGLGPKPHMPLALLKIKYAVFSPEVPSDEKKDVQVVVQVSWPGALELQSIAEVMDAGPSRQATALRHSTPPRLVGAARLQHISHADGQVPSRNAFFDRFERVPIPGLFKAAPVQKRIFHTQDRKHRAELVVHAGAQGLELAVRGRGLRRRSCESALRELRFGRGPPRGPWPCRRLALASSAFAA